MQVQRKRKSQKGRRLLPMEVSALPKNIRSWPSARHTLRWSNYGTAGVGGSITVSYNILLDAVNVATTATTAYQVYDAVRVRRARLWVTSDAAVGAINAPAGASISLLGGTTGAVGVQQETNAVSISNAEPGFCTIKPSSMSAAALFQTNGGGAAYKVDILGLARIVIEVDCDFEFNSDNAPTAVAQAPVGAIVGQFYFRGMDGNRVGATNWQSMLIPAN